MGIMLLPTMAVSTGGLKQATYLQGSEPFPLKADKEAARTLLLTTPEEPRSADLNVPSLMT